MVERTNELKSGGYEFNSGWQKMDRNKNKSNDRYDEVKYDDLSEKIKKIDDEINRFKEKSETVMPVEKLNNINEDKTYELINETIINTKVIIDEMKNLRDELSDIRNNQDSMNQQMDTLRKNAENQAEIIKELTLIIKNYNDKEQKNFSMLFKKR